MSKLFERLVNLLGTPIDNPDFQTFLNEFGETPRFEETNWFHLYQFLGSGITMMTDKRQDQFKMLSIHLITASTKSRAMKPFTDVLPFGILPTDDRQTVLEKVGVERHAQEVQGRTPRDPKDFYDNYTIHPLEYSFIFDGSGKKLGLVSVHYLINPIPVEPRPPDPNAYIERISEGMIEVIELAKEEALALKNPYIGSDFLLLGLTKNSTSIAATALLNAGVSTSALRNEIGKIVGIGSRQTATPQYTPAAKAVLANALEIANKFGSHEIREEHCLLSIICSEGVGIRTLENLGVDFKRLEEAIQKLMREAE